MILKESEIVSELHTSKGRKSSREIDLKQIILKLKKRLWLIVLITTLCTILGGIYNARPEPPAYVSSTRIIINTSTEMMNTAKVLFKEPILLNQVIEQLSLERSASQLRGQIKVDNVDGSLIVLLSVIDSNPQTAANIANKSVELYKIVGKETLGISNVRVLSDAEPNPTSINTKSNTMIYAAFLLGLALSVGLTFLLDTLDDTLRTENEIEELLQLNVLGHVSKIKRKDFSKNTKKQKSILVRGETVGS